MLVSRGGVPASLLPLLVVVGAGPMWMMTAAYRGVGNLSTHILCLLSRAVFLSGSEHRGEGHRERAGRERLPQHRPSGALEEKIRVPIGDVAGDEHHARGRPGQIALESLVERAT